jgi:hypothetical protein
VFEGSRPARRRELVTQFALLSRIQQDYRSDEVDNRCYEVQYFIWIHNRFPPFLYLDSIISFTS